MIKYNPSFFVPMSLNSKYESSPRGNTSGGDLFHLVVPLICGLSFLNTSVNFFCEHGPGLSLVPPFVQHL